MNMGTGVVGDILGMNGFFYKTTLDAQYDGTSPAGIVIYRAPRPSLIDRNWYYQSIGLVMALKDAGEAEWDDAKDNFITCQDANTIADFGSLAENPEASEDLDGYMVSTRMVGGSFKDCHHPAAQMAVDYIKTYKVNSERVSPWFLPTLGELTLAFWDMAKNPGNVSSEYENYKYNELFQPTVRVFSEKFWKMLDNMFYKAYVPQSDKTGKSGIPEGMYWLATQTNENDAWMFFLNSTVLISTGSKSKTCKVRPVCAFTY
jgi:hypothetical protein